MIFIEKLFFQEQCSRKNILYRMLIEYSNDVDGKFQFYLNIIRIFKYYLSKTIIYKCYLNMSILMYVTISIVSGARFIANLRACRSDSLPACLLTSLPIYLFASLPARLPACMRACMPECTPECLLA